MSIVFVYALPKSTPEHQHTDSVFDYIKHTLHHQLYINITVHHASSYPQFNTHTRHSIHWFYCTVCSEFISELHNYYIGPREEICRVKNCMYAILDSRSVCDCRFDGLHINKILYILRIENCSSNVVHCIH